MKKILMFFLIILFIPVNCSAMEISAKSAILIEADTGRVIYSKNCRERMGMASTTKIMTCLVALDKYNENDVITVSANASGVEGSSVYLKSGEKMSFKDVLYGLMLASGNDAAVAVAEHVGGNVYNFVDSMNKKTANLGLSDTHFENPNGLSDDNHYTTAYDLAQITKKALENKTFREIVSSKNKVLKSLSGENDRYIKNHNKLLWNYENCIGVKTGFTKKDGRCLVSSATKEGVTLIAVTLKAPNDWKDHEKMLDYGFGKLNMKNIITKGKYAGEIKVIDGILPTVKCEYGESYSLSLMENEEIKTKVLLPDKIKAPIKKGDEIGFVQFLLNNEIMGEVKIVTAEEVDVTKKTKFMQQFINLFSLLIKK